MDRRSFVSLGIAALLGVEAERRARSVPSPALVAAATLAAVRHITPSGGGLRDGSTLDDAGTLGDLPVFVDEVGPGGEIWVHGGFGPYAVQTPVTIGAGGEPGNPVVVRGVDRVGGSTVRAVLVGTRAYPWAFELPEGSDGFVLTTGADHLQFRNLDFANVRIALAVDAPVADLVIEDARADRMRHLIFARATVSGLTVRRTEGFGYLKMFYLGADTNAVLLEDVLGDAAGQTNAFPMGVQLDGTTHDVTMRRVTMRNHRSNKTKPTVYWNGDGFSAEEATYDLLYEDTTATGNTDSGYDIKARSARLVRATAADNKQNFRCRHRGVTLTDSVSENPVRRGGTGQQLHVQANALPGDIIVPVVLQNCRVTDSGPASADSTVFRAENGAVIDVEGGSVRYSTGGVLISEVNGGTVTVNGVDISGPPPDVIAPTPPTDLRSTSANTAITLSWDASTDDVAVAGYTVYRNGMQVRTTTGTTLKDTGLTRRTSYDYTVESFDRAGNTSSPSATRTARTT